MHRSDLNRVVFHSKEDWASGHYLQKGESILRGGVKSEYDDINDVLERYHLKKYIDNDVFLKDWSQDDIRDFRQKASEYGKTIGRFMSHINDDNFIDIYEKVIYDYIESFWELVDNQGVFKQVSKENFKTILSREPHSLHTILTYKYLVSHYDLELRESLLGYSLSAEILLSIYEVKDDFRKNRKILPKSLTLEDKEKIISDYLDSHDHNLNYIGLIPNVKNRNDFILSDKTRLKAKRLHKSETEKFFTEKGGMKYGVSISFPEDTQKIIDECIDDEHIFHYSYSLDFIKENNEPFLLFKFFKYLFEYLDNQYRINLVSKKSQMDVLERVMGVHSKNEYRGGTAFSLAEMTSQAQIYGYDKILRGLNSSLEDILQFVFTSAFQEKYSFAENARFSIPTAISYFEKVRLLAPEFESALKQFKLFVENGDIDFELLQISSLPSPIRDIPSLNQDKYIYFNDCNKEMVGCSNLFFSDQTLLAYVDPFKDKKYKNFFDLLANEEVKFDSYHDYQKNNLNYLIEKGFISVDNHNFIQVTNFERVLILKDLYENEVGSFYHYPFSFQREARQMESENIVYFESSLFSKPEQAYFNYFLNKSEFTNGVDLRNSYLHGTQADPDEIQKHEYTYFTYLKLIFLAFLKIDDDLNIYKHQKDSA